MNSTTHPMLRVALSRFTEPNASPELVYFRLGSALGVCDGLLEGGVITPQQADAFHTAAFAGWEAALAALSTPTL